MGQTVQNALKPVKGAATKDPIKRPLAKAPLPMAFETGHDLHKMLFLLSRISMLLALVKALLASILGRNLATAMSKLSTIVPIGQAQLQKATPSTISKATTRNRATRVGTRRSSATFPVRSACIAPSGSTSQDPGTGLLQPLSQILQGDSFRGR